MSIRVMIADDHAVVRQGLRALIESEPDMEIVAEAADGNQAIELAETHTPDVIVMDILMPGTDGIEATSRIRQATPGAAVLALTSFSEDHNIFPAIRAGVLGYMLKDSGPDDLLRAVREVAAGKSFLHPEIAGRLLGQLGGESDSGADESLSEREEDVLRLIAQGLSNSDIAGSLQLSGRTVGTHVSSILGKLGLENRTQAAIYALKVGLVRLDDGRQSGAK